MYTMADYESKTHNVYLTASLAATEKVRLFGTVSYNMAKASLDEIIMPDITERLANPNVAGGYDLTHQDFTFDHMHTYSDLDYQIMKLVLGGEYQITPTITFTADGSYADLKDDTGYVFGDETGSYFVVRSGFRFSF